MTQTKDIDVANNDKNNSETATKNKGGRPKKELFVNEQQNIATKLLNILAVTKTGDMILIEDIDKSKQDQIMALKDDTKKYFPSSGWSVFSKKVSNPHISLLKSILKATNYKLKTFRMKDNTEGKTLKHGMVVTFPK